MKVFAFCFSAIGFLSLVFYTQEKQLPFPLSVSAVSSMVLAIGVVTALLVATVLSIVLAPRLAQMGFLGPLYENLYITEKGVLVSKWKRFGIFPLIAYLPILLTISVSMLDPFNGNWSAAAGLSIYVVWVLSVGWVLADRKWSWEFARSVAVFNFALFFSFFCFCLLLIVFLREYSFDKDVWAAVVALIVFVSIQTLLSVPWINPTLINGKVSQATQIKRRKIGMQMILVTFALITIYVSLIPRSSASVGSFAMRQMGIGGGMPLSYCFDPTKFPRSLQRYRIGSSSCTHLVPTFLRIGESVYVESPCIGIPWVSFARSLVLEEIPPPKVTGLSKPTPPFVPQICNEIPFGPN